MGDSRRPFGAGLAWTERTAPLPETSEPRTPVTVVTGAGQAVAFANLASPDLALGNLALPDLALTKLAHAPGAVVLPGDPDTPPAALRTEDGPSAALGGCACCAIQSNLQRRLRALLPKARRGEISRVIITAAPDADPVAILATVLSDPALVAVYRIAEVIAVADGRSDGGWGAGGGIAVADSVLVRDAGGAEPDRIRALNPAARIIGSLSDLQRREGEARMAVTAQADNAVTMDSPLDWPPVSRWLERIAGRGQGQLQQDEDDGTTGSSDQTASRPASWSALSRPSRSLAADGPAADGPQVLDGRHQTGPDAEAVQRAVVDGRHATGQDAETVQRALAGRPDSLGGGTEPSLRRITGVLHLAQCGKPVAIDTAGHRLAPPLLLPAWPVGQPPRSRLVFMGHGLDMAAIRTALARFAVRPPAGTG